MPLTFWGYVGVTWLLVQVTLMSVTLYLHRDATHRSVDLHPSLRHFCRCWIWMTSAMLTREWVAVHRKHHAFADLAADPHSPVNVGMRRILLEGAEFYARESRNPHTLEHYGKGVPNDWMERRIYSRYRYAGIVLLVVCELALFGIAGISMIGIQMLAMPVLAAGVINGLGHGVGYRNYEVDNAATNVLPWGCIVGGEELHNNHHAFPASAKFSIRAWEFDAGWLCLVVLRSLGLARIKRLAPRPRIIDSAQPADPHAVHEVICNRMHVLRAYVLQVLVPVLAQELPADLQRNQRRSYRKLLSCAPAQLDAASHGSLRALLDAYPVLGVVHPSQAQLRQLWEAPHADHLALEARFDHWCLHAKASGVPELQCFAVWLQRFSIGKD
jgi:stearoyl-CoA desaturase (delta-9 desaturase)